MRTIVEMKAKRVTTEERERYLRLGDRVANHVCLRRIHRERAEEAVLLNDPIKHAKRPGPVRRPHTEISSMSEV